MFLWVVVVIVLVSVLWALVSLRSQMKHSELRQAKQELSKGRVVYVDQNSSSKTSPKPD